jgi:hypothetical protein
MTGDSLNVAEMNPAELQQRLSDRERLVGELTSRLEQAAEQLDRLRRTGADRGGRGMGGIPPELITQQQSLTEELQNAVQQWEEMQPTELLARVEMQVTELRDLIVDRLHNGSLSFAATADSESIPSGAAERPKKAAKAGGPQENGDGLSSYEAFKAGLLDTDDPEAAHEEKSPQAEAPAQTVELKKEQKPRETQPVEIPAADPPAAVDFDAATPDDLRAAVDERDSYIAYLIRRLRAAEATQKLAGSWSDLDGVPDELRGRLEEHEQKLQESLRLAEVETSVERARLGREAMRLEHLGNQIRKQAVQLGLSDDDSSESEEPGDEADQETAKKNGRWFRLFGK